MKGRGTWLVIINYPVWDRRRMTKGGIDYYPSIDA